MEVVLDQRLLHQQIGADISKNQCTPQVWIMTTSSSSADSGNHANAGCRHRRGNSQICSAQIITLTACTDGNMTTHTHAPHNVFEVLAEELRLQQQVLPQLLLQWRADAHGSTAAGVVPIAAQSTAGIRSDVADRLVRECGANCTDRQFTCTPTAASLRGK